MKCPDCASVTFRDGEAWVCAVCGRWYRPAEQLIADLWAHYLDVPTMDYDAALARVAAYTAEQLAEHVVPPDALEAHGETWTFTGRLTLEELKDLGRGFRSPEEPKS